MVTAPGRQDLAEALLLPGSWQTRRTGAPRVVLNRSEITYIHDGYARGQDGRLDRVCSESEPGSSSAEFERAGRPSDPHAMPIGAHARNAGLIVATNNPREFERIPGLRIQKWAELAKP